jgi:hypothetical protein
MADSAGSAGQGSSGESLVPDFDRLPITALRNLIRSLTQEQLRQLLDHERLHGRRQPVMELVQDRIAQLARGAPPRPPAPGSPAGAP